jgi:hypothetical protein
MKLIHDDGEVTDAVGFVDLGNLAIPRQKLAKMLPDIERFERCLSNPATGANCPAWIPGVRQ